MSTKRILVTGATGKVGSVFIDQLLNDSRYESYVVRAMLHNRPLAPRDRLETIHGSIENEDIVHKALEGVTHVVHLATCKEIPSQIMDVAVKGMFWLLEACRQSDSFEQFILIGGDAGMGHFHYPHPLPVTEQQKHSAYPGCYALSKVLEEVMLEQYYIQYNFNGCCLRAPWIMEKDDFKYHLTFSKAVFGGPRWYDLVTPEKASEFEQTNTIPIMLDAQHNPIKRNFVHVEDLVSAILLALNHPSAHQQTYNISMDEPVNYHEVGEYLEARYGLPTVNVVTEFHSTWLDNTKAKHLLGWRPRFDFKRLIDSAWAYQRSSDEPRVVWYPG